MSRPGMERLAVRWTVGDVSLRGFEALRLSIQGAWTLFGPKAAYIVCVNSIPLAEARRRTGAVPEAVIWRAAISDALPPAVARFLDGGMAEGVAWKFAPLRIAPDRYELSLDNDCILWDMPAAIATWLESDAEETCVLAADVRACFGQFAGHCGPEPRNTGIRGLPPGFNLGDALQTILAKNPVPLVSELDEQGLQVAALSRRRTPLVVSVEEVTICSPFPPHLPDLGRCGAHFVGLNAKHLPWQYYDRPAVDCIAEHWMRHRPDLYRAVGLTPPART